MYFVCDNILCVFLTKPKKKYFHIICKCLEQSSYPSINRNDLYHSKVGQFVYSIYKAVTNSADQEL